MQASQFYCVVTMPEVCNFVTVLILNTLNIYIAITHLVLMTLPPSTPYTLWGDGLKDATHFIDAMTLEQDISLIFDVL